MAEKLATGVALASPVGSSPTLLDHVPSLREVVSGRTFPPAVTYSPTAPHEPAAPQATEKRLPWPLASASSGSASSAEPDHVPAVCDATIARWTSVALVYEPTAAHEPAPTHDTDSTTALG